MERKRKRDKEEEEEEEERNTLLFTRFVGLCQHSLSALTLDDSIKKYDLYLRLHFEK
jgi:hypothetical protein